MNLFRLILGIFEKNNLCSVFEGKRQNTAILLLTIAPLGGLSLKFFENFILIDNHKNTVAPWHRSPSLSRGASSLAELLHPANQDQTV